MTATVDRAAQTTEIPRVDVVGVAASRGPAEVERPRVISARTGEDWLALVGSGLASLATVWLFYEQILPFSGKLGFFLVWYLLFLGTYALVTALSNPRPILVDRVMSAVVTGGFAVIVLALLATVVYVFVHGFGAYRHLTFFTQDASNVGPVTPLNQGGIEHVLVGSAIQIGIAVVFSLPLGVLTAVYLTEARGRLPKIIRTVVEAMTALPDLIAGLFVYAFFILVLGLGKTGLAASLALSITMLPIIARSSEVVLRIVPGGLREASLALGASRWRTVWNVVLPTARPGLAGSLILGVARGVGETAPLLIVSGASNFFNDNPLHDPMNSLPLYIYSSLRSGQVSTLEVRGFGAAAVLLVVVVLFFIAVRLLARQRTRRS